MNREQVDSMRNDFVDFAEAQENKGLSIDEIESFIGAVYVKLVCGRCSDVSYKEKVWNTGKVQDFVVETMKNLKLTVVNSFEDWVKEGDHE